MLKTSGCAQDGVVWLNDGIREVLSRVDSELQFRLLTIVGTETFHQQRGESGSRASAEAVEYQEALETSALIGQLADAVEYQIDDFFANGVVATSVVVGSIFLTSDELFWVKQLTVGSSADLI